MLAPLERLVRSQIALPYRPGSPLLFLDEQA